MLKKRKKKKSRRLTSCIVYAHLRGRRSIGDLNSQDHFAGEVIQQLARKLRWDSAVMDWYAYAPNRTIMGYVGNSGTIEINVLLGDKIALHLTDQQTSNVMPQLSLENVIRDFGDTLEDRLYDLKVEFCYMIVCTLNSLYSKKKCNLTICGEISVYVSLYNRMVNHVKYM